jgi:hypothetical protein
VDACLARIERLEPRLAIVLPCEARGWCKEQVNHDEVAIGIPSYEVNFAEQGAFILNAGGFPTTPMCVQPEDGWSKLSYAIA